MARHRAHMVAAEGGVVCGETAPNGTVCSWSRVSCKRCLALKPRVAVLEIVVHDPRGPDALKVRARERRARAESLAMPQPSLFPLLPV